jgi:hypothetical protein
MGLRVTKRFKKKVLDRRLMGSIDYWWNPELGVAWGGPFNGQAFRQALFKELLAALAPAALVETGTYRGTTTEFLAEGGVPVFTIEVRPRNYGFSRARLRQRTNVTLRHGDSRKELRSLLDGPLRGLSHRPLFFYLDAHWKGELPLAAEIDLVYARCQAAIVMIDDFQVPGDAGYAYDDYGPGKALTPAYIAPALAAHGLAAFYPSTPSAEESGARRGCVVLAKDAVHGRTLEAIALLRRG